MLPWVPSAPFFYCGVLSFFRVKYHSLHIVLLFIFIPLTPVRSCVQVLTSCTVVEVLKGSTRIDDEGVGVGVQWRPETAR